MLGLGAYDALIVAAVALLLFGTRLPSVMRSLGQGVNEFKKGLKESSEEVEGDKIEPDPKRTAPAEKEKEQV